MPRDVFETELWKCLKPAHFAVFLTCLKNANWKGGTWWDGREVVTINRGQFVTSYSKLGGQVCSGVGIGVVRRALQVLERMGELIVKRTQQFTLITVVNYEAYADLNLYFGTPTDTPNDTGVTRVAHSSDTGVTTIEDSNTEKQEDRDLKALKALCRSTNVDNSWMEGLVDELLENWGGEEYRRRYFKKLQGVPQDPAWAIYRDVHDQYVRGLVFKPGSVFCERLDQWKKTGEICKPA